MMTKPLCKLCEKELKPDTIHFMLKNGSHVVCELCAASVWTVVTKHLEKKKDSRMVSVPNQLYPVVLALIKAAKNKADKIIKDGKNGLR